MKTNEVFAGVIIGGFPVDLTLKLPVENGRRKNSSIQFIFGNVTNANVHRTAFYVKVLIALLSRPKQRYESYYDKS